MNKASAKSASAAKIPTARAVDLAPEAGVVTCGRLEKELT
jgi:hypothetical protein